MNKKVLIIGAGPAGLTAAYEFLTKTDIKPIIIEATTDIGGISKTVNYKGNKIDIGGHRFFSKSDIVMNWWKNILPIEDKSKNATDPEKTDKIFLIRNRLSRILFCRQFFDYPISLSIRTIRNLGIIRLFRILVSYLYSATFQRKPEKSLEDFFINRFGKELYKTFFKSYTEKVWGVACNEISPSWGAQRIKGLSITKTIFHAFSLLFQKKKDLAQKKVETSLISMFLYPKYGPGQLWTEVTDIVTEKGATLLFEHEAIGFKADGNKIISCSVLDKKNNTISEIECDYLFSTMPVRDLINGLGSVVPDEIKNIAAGLVYRDFITVGVLLDKVTINRKNNNKPLDDNWIYIQEPDVMVGRIQIFNNWSPYMINDPSKTWIGMEYFCFENDELWNRTDKEMNDFAIEELEKIGFALKSDVIDSIVIKILKTYPCYFGTYNQFDSIIKYMDNFPNLFLIGRNGMHKYNNQDHSMLTAMVAVDNILKGIESKENIWSINLEEEYHEEKDKNN